MKISTYATPQSIVDEAGTIKSRYVIVIDTLRATSVITSALAAGAKGVIPVMEIDEAVRLYHNLGADEALLCGEREGNPIPGFHFGNSPAEYHHGSVGGKTLVMTTTNGTRAILAADKAAELAIGCMLNASAVAGHAQQSGRDVTILCAGTRGRFTTEDVLTAGAIIDALGTDHNGLDDLSVFAHMFYKRFEHDLMGGLRLCTHAEDLIHAGYGADVEYCMRKDYLSVVAYYEKGLVRL